MSVRFDSGRSKELEFITRYAEDLSEINQKKLEPEFEEIKCCNALFQNDPEKLHKAIVRIATEFLPGVLNNH